MLSYDLTYWHGKDDERLSPFYIQQTLDEKGGHVKNASRLQDGSFLVEAKWNDQSKTLLK
jgi:hypothetical protein